VKVRRRQLRKTEGSGEKADGSKSEQSERSEKVRMMEKRRKRKQNFSNRSGGLGGNSFLPGSTSTIGSRYPIAM
jgi:hypothetical protein